MGIDEEIEAIEEEIAETPYNKATEQHIGRLKAKLAELREEREQQDAGQGGGEGYHVAKTGDATVAMVGFPSVGKSTLLNALTNAESEVGSYDFTTLEVNPGMVSYRGANIQLLDVPGLIQGAAGGRGGGREVLSVVRAADCILLVLSPFDIDHYTALIEELRANHVRVDADPPRVRVTEKPQGGIDVTTTVDVPLDEETIIEVVREHGYVNADVHIADPVDVDRLVDSLMDNRVYVPSVTAVNKIDLVDESYRETVHENLTSVGLDPDEVVFVSGETGAGLDALRERLWSELDLTRVYMQKPGEDPDYDEPLVLTDGTTVADALERIGGDIAERFRFGRVTGPSAAHDDQRVGRDHELADEDVLQLVLRR